MKKNLFKSAVLALCISVYGCDDGGAYLKHDLEYQKIGDCGNLDAKINVVANTIGERYEFQECLDVSYKGEYTVGRKGDTVDVRFDKPKAGGVLYKITLDINTRPEYNFVTLNGSTFPVSVKRY